MESFNGRDSRIWIIGLGDYTILTVIPDGRDHFHVETIRKTHGLGNTNATLKYIQICELEPIMAASVLDCVPKAVPVAIPVT